jgi:hypothetical protein
MGSRTHVGKVLRTEWLHLFIEVTRTIEQEDFEGWLKNRLLGGS